MDVDAKKHQQGMNVCYTVPHLVVYQEFHNFDYPTIVRSSADRLLILFSFHLHMSGCTKI